MITAMLSIVFVFLLRAVSMAASPNRIFVDATAISFEELLQTDYIPASQIANQVSKASSAVSIVTAQDIKDYGYRSLAEILQSMRGLYVFYDYGYSYLSGRGYGAPGDYAGRIIVLIDGYRADDVFFGQAYLAEDGLLDVSLIERVEYIPGGGSAGYGNGALLGAINIITKTGRDFDGMQVAPGAGSNSGRRGRVTLGQHFESGADVLASVSTFTSHGRDFTFTDDLGGGDKDQNGVNDEKSLRLFLKVAYGDFSFEGGLVDHKKELPSYAVSSVFAEKPSLQTDDNCFARLKYDNDLGRDLKLSASLWYGAYRYGYDEPFAYWDGDTTTFSAASRARWHGTDIKLIGTWFKNHTLSFGAEYRYDHQLEEEFEVFDTALNEALSGEMMSYPSRRTYGAYLYDEYAFASSMALNAGLRYEKGENGFRALSPQAALIWEPWERTVLKLSSGITNRRATVFEGDNDKPERAWTTEFVLEQRFRAEAKLLVSFYRYRISDRITMNDEPDIEAEGAEAEFEKHWLNGMRLRTSYAYQHAVLKDTDEPLTNTPRHMAKFNLSAPVFGERLRVGFELQYIGKRPDGMEGYLPSYLVGNLNLLSHELLPNTDVSLTIRNVANAHYDDLTERSFSGETTYPREGRTLWFGLEHTFR